MPRTAVRTALALSLTLSAAALLPGCVVVPARGYAAAGEVVDVAPPAPQYEAVGVAPAVGWVWLSGYWGWYGGRHHWVAGHWEAPRAGYRWVPHRWAAEGGRWRLHPGHWSRH